MKCREFIERATELHLADVVAGSDEQLTAHLQECRDCTNWYQQRETIAAAIAALRNSTAAAQASPSAEAAVLRAFRQSSTVATPGKSTGNWFALNLGSLLARGGYAAVAATLAIALGGGIWVWQRAERPSQSADSPNQAQQSASDEGRQPAHTSDMSATLAPQPQQSVAAGAARSGSRQMPADSESLAQLSQAQGYIPLMLCDPLSCSGDEQVLRMEIPASVAGGIGSSEPQLADVVIGDDGLVRAIRIVQQ